MKPKKRRKKIPKKTSMSKKIVKKVKRRRIRFGRLFLALISFGFFLFLISKCLDFPIRNIYIEGNHYITDQEVIELAGIENYPSIIKTLAIDIQKRLKKDPRIISASIKKKRGKEIIIKITENYPLFYHQTMNVTVLADLREIEGAHSAPVLLNYVPDTIYPKFKEKTQQIDASILERISEIMYQPSNVDEERFLFTMRDGNYVYLTLETLETINNYVSIYAEFISKYGNKKGILNLDFGQYFTLLP